jgi:hypothetical protein
MDRALPLVGPRRGGLVARRRSFRWQVLRPIRGQVVSADLPVLLHDIGAGGFSAVASGKLTPGTAYDLRFALHPEIIVLKARLVRAMRIRGDQETGYLLGLVFVDAKLDEAAIQTLIAEVTTAAP